MTLHEEYETKRRDTYLAEYRRALAEFNKWNKDDNPHAAGMIDAWDSICEFLYNELDAMGYTPQFDGKTGALLDPQPWA